jgi:uncharacterized protein (DUF2236 family)
MAHRLSLPSPLQRRIEALAEGLLSPGGAAVPDFSEPKGEPALVAAGSVSWRVFANPVTLFVGGVAAVILELAEPRVRHGVWEHSAFRARPLERLQRTGLAALVTIYGPESRARAMIEGVRAAHERVSGTTPEGVAYRATDPKLLDWVQATAAWGFLSAYTEYARALGGGERDSYYSEGVPVGALYGATGAPASEAAWEALYRRMLPALGPSQALDEFLAIMDRVEALPGPARPLQRLLVRAAVSVVPEGLRRTLRIADRGLRRWERPLAAATAAAAEQLRLDSWPSVQAARRLGREP